jgi:hypothetical protein
VNTKSENEINLEDEINLYDYWKVLVKRKKIFISIFLVPLMIVSVVSFSVPRYYRGETEISYPATPVSPAPNIAKLIGDIDETKKAKIFTKNSDAIKNVSVSLTKKSTDKVTILVDAKTADIIPQAFKDIVDYMNNMPEVKEEIARFNEKTNSKIKRLIEAKKANLVFLNQITDMMKKRQITFISINPADLISKDIDLSLEILNLQKAEIKFGVLGPLNTSMQPSNSLIKQIIIITGLLSLFTCILGVFFLEYLDRIKAREHKQSKIP